MENHAGPVYLVHHFLPCSLHFHTGPTIHRGKVGSLTERVTPQVEAIRDATSEKQKARAMRVSKDMPQKLLRLPSTQSQEELRQLANIQQARKNRSGDHRSSREITESVFNLLKDGRERSVTEIAKSIHAGWTTVYWCLDNVEFCQSQPFLERDRDKKRKRYYKLLSPARRRT